MPNDEKIKHEIFHEHRDQLERRVEVLERLRDDPCLQETALIAIWGKVKSFDDFIDAINSQLETLPKWMTAEEVAEKLGLEPFRKFEQEARARNKKEFTATMGAAAAARSETRRTGRTTAMLCEAVAHASHGEVVTVVGYDQRWTRELRNMAQAMAVKVGVDPELFVLPSKKAEFQFNDHHYSTRY